MVTTNYHPCGSGYCLQSPMDQFAIDISMMESDLHHPVAVLGRVCSTFISAKPKYLDQSLCLGLADCLNFTAQMLTVVQRNIDSVVQKYPDIFRELYIIAYRAHLLVERCCSEEWLRILFLQACTSHKEEALDVIDDLEWCITEIWKISCLPRLPPQALLRFKKLLKECEGFDRSELVKQLERHALVPLERQELQLTKYLLERIKVQVVASTPSEIAVSLDYRNHILAGANGFTASVFVGQGSSAKVYKTTFLEIQCAKKVQTTVSKDQLQELAKQARKLATLSHPHVIKLLGFYEDRRTDEGIFEGHWLMECMDGDLRSNISRCLNQYSISVDILLQIAKGVRYLHDNDVAHRDLKCDNILVSQSPVSSKVSTSAYKDYFHIKVTDFDQSKFFTSNCSDLQVQSKNHVGSTPWRAPEAFTEPGKSMVNPKSADSYSFAMTCFELLSGENPFSAMPGINWSKAKEALVAGRRPPLPKDCPELLRELIVECWQTNPVQRPAFTEICRRLQDVRAVLLTGSLTQRKKQRGAPSFLRHNAQRIVSMFKTVRKVTTSRYAFYLLTMSRAGL
jgi:serine/threonine protein kinase